ncbi:MAG: YggS family pyridoxal phosphate-dependent enzyme [Ruminococcus sp.]|jgi:pyridoxal phosphate enzyme (YggS family)|nr:YggS family pyridoxal phosphate-dependent enzyme [Ruminococcus sp.]
MENLKSNYEKIVYNVNQAYAAANSAGNKMSKLTEIMAVTKTVSADRVNAAIQCGISRLGENRVQEYLSKKDDYSGDFTVDFIGSLQTNKVRQIISYVNLIHSLDNIGLATEVNKCAKKIDKIQRCLVEVNIGLEVTKSGVLPENLRGFLTDMEQFENIEICGLMCIPPFGNSAEYFPAMQDLFEETRATHTTKTGFDTLSMGMSDDYEQAVKYGSTIVRIGSALFGRRG